MSFTIDPLYVFYAFAAIAAVLAAEAVYLLFSGAKAYRTGVNRRLRVAQSEANHEKVLLQLKRERGIVDGESRLSGLRRLVVQTGLSISPIKAALVVIGVFATTFMTVLVWRADLVEALAAGTVAALAGPLGALVLIRNRRRNRFGEQLPEAIDVIVRSLRAGHPVPIAITLVGREMPDPVGTEFGMVADEITYGKDMEGALRAMSERVGQEDLPLFITSVSIQASTGGNLSQILENLSRVIRERFKLRRKIRGLSAEGRMSAMILNLVPFGVFAIVNLMSPDFYADTWKHPYGYWFVGAAVGWMGIGNLIMRRMINFKF